VKHAHGQDEGVEPVQHLAVEDGDGVGAHDAAEPSREALEPKRGSAVVADVGGRVEREIRRDRREGTVASGGSAVGVALIAAFGLPAAQRRGDEHDDRKLMSC
jgi:hypothetical protein